MKGTWTESLFESHDYFWLAHRHKPKNYVTLFKNYIIPPQSPPDNFAALNKTYYYGG
jgi:hypothetical protein